MVCMGNVETVQRRMLNNFKGCVFLMCTAKMPSFHLWCFIMLPLKISLRKLKKRVDLKGILKD
jgi:hypothetical protein